MQRLPPHRIQRAQELGEIGLEENPAAAGLGAGCVCATTTAMGGPAGLHHPGLVSGIGNTCHELGGALGLACVAAIGGTRASFTAGAVLALLVAVSAWRLLPAGRPEVDPDRPAFAH